MPPRLSRMLATIKHHISHHLLHGTHEVLHLAYFGLVFIESHGLYGYAAGGLFLITIAAFFGGGE